jgi:alpha-1,3-mannosyltransferase
MARGTPRTSRLRGGGRGRGGGNLLDRLVTALAQLLAPLGDPHNMAAHTVMAVVLLVAEAALCLLIIRRVPYTEIDWEAYMQEVGGYMEGELDYAKLKGDTGPLVYPAGFVYLFAWLRRLTGGSVVAAQYIFAALYLATQAVVMALYARTAALPPWSLALLCGSRRLHSIFLLRLFNDCWAMFVAYVATLALQSRRWVLAVVLYSLAVSVKMNVLLMAPGVLAVLLKYARPGHVVAGTALGVALQAALGAPFLWAYPHSYLTRAFEFSRVRSSCRWLCIVACLRGDYAARLARCAVPLYKTDCT